MHAILQILQHTKRFKNLLRPKNLFIGPRWIISAAAQAKLGRLLRFKERFEQRAQKEQPSTSHDRLLKLD
jgi:hypothetical protein